MTKNEYRIAFEQTNYLVFINDDETLLLKTNETNKHLLSFFPHLNSWAFITAWNPLPNILSLEENRERNKSMEEDIQTNGWEYHFGLGVSADENWQEESFFIINCSSEDAEKLSAKYGQMAFVYGEAGEVAQIVYLK
jgi:hypothetical protein